MKKIFVAALVCALLTGMLFLSYLKSLQQTEAPPTETVITAATDIPAYTVLKEEMLTQQTLPLGSAHALAARETAPLIGKITETPLVAGEQILPQKLKQAGSPEGGLAYAIPKGMRAMTLEVGEISSVGYHLRVGDLVDVIAVGAVMNPEGKAGTEDETVIASFFVAEQLEILVLGAKNSEAVNSYGTVTLLVTPQQALRLADTKHNGYAMQLILRSAGDDSETVTAPVFLKDLP